MEKLGTYSPPSSRLTEQESSSILNYKLKQLGVIVRPVSGYAMPTFLRVSIGTQAENQRFLDALTQVLKQA